MSEDRSWFAPIVQLAEFGGPVLVILLIVSVLTGALILLKIGQYQLQGVGRRKRLQEALDYLDAGDEKAAADALSRSSHFLAPVVKMGMKLRVRPSFNQRLESEAEKRFAALEGGFRILDTVAQLAPLLGLLGTVIGMIEAFQALQEAGSQVDPSDLAGGIWVALMTTAAGLSVAMPTSIALSWFEARVDTERAFAEYAFATLATPAGSAKDGA
ncbi:MAG: MotA/TolQ/ExbB proton channel family protein [Pseudomonadota bacterium]